VTRPEISVVVPAYRAERTIGRTVDSVLAQEGVAAEVIVIIDGDFDGTGRLLEAYPSDRVRVTLNSVNQGASRSRNEGLALASADYVMFLDSDDFLEGPLLSGLLGRMRAVDADMGFGPMQILHERRDRRDSRIFRRFSSSEDAIRQWLVEGHYVPTCSLVWRTEFVRGIGGWDETLSKNDDGELAVRALLLGARFISSDEGCGIYVKHSSESLNSRTDNLASLLLAGERLLAIESSVLPREIQRAIAGGQYFNIAWECYLAGRDELGDEALTRSRSLGFRGRGPLRYRLLFPFIGVRRTAHLVRRLKTFVQNA
jgi:glycosyltransferase involved in cell wall biosynthesis